MKQSTIRLEQFVKWFHVHHDESKLLFWRLIALFQEWEGVVYTEEAAANGKRRQARSCKQVEETVGCTPGTCQKA